MTASWGHGSWGDYFGRFLVPVLLGNVAGGTALVVLGHAQVAADAALVTLLSGAGRADSMAGVLERG